jgi:hypothetical protein
MSKNKINPRMPQIPVFDLKHIYNLGYNCGKNGANEINCHFACFASLEKTKEWERGKNDAKRCGGGK